MKKVLHVFRKFLPSTATFIRNQISHHNTYRPSILYAEDVYSEMADGLRENIHCEKAVSGKLGETVYDKFRQLTPSEVNKTIDFIESLSPNIIHVHYGVDMLTFSKVLKRIKIPIVVSFYGYDCTSFPMKLQGLGKLLLQKKVFNNQNVRAIFAMSEDMQKDLLNIGCPEELIRVHYYGSECLRFKFDRQYAHKEVVNFTIISGFTEKKGHIILLEAWKLLLGKITQEVALLIVGSGEMEDEIKDFIKNNNFKNVRIKGFVQYGSKEHMDVFQNTDVFIHPSITALTGDKEGIPGAIIEAMANGLPVISTFHAGIPYIIKNEETGLLVEERNVKQLAEAMAKLVEDEKLRESIGRRASDYAINNLDIGVKEIELEKLYDEFIKID